MVRVLVSLTERDAPALGELSATGPSGLSQFVASVSAAGLRVQDCHEASSDDLEELASTWLKRLDIPRKRAAYVLTAVR